MTPAIVERMGAWLDPSRVLNDGERVTFEGLALERRRRDWLAGRIAAKRVIRAAARRSGERVPAYCAITIWNGPDGAPAFTIEHRPDLAECWNISIAHTEGVAVSALARTDRDGSVGVDIERAKPLSVRLLRYVLTSGERERLREQAPSESRALLIWTAKEAAFKAAHGQCANMREVELAWSDADRMTARIAAEQVPAHEIRVRHRVLGAHAVAVALCSAVRAA